MKKIYGVLIVSGLLALYALIFQDNCASPCSDFSFINPFGISMSGGGCIAVCQKSPQWFFYLAVDVFIITGAYIMYKKKKLKK